MVGGFDNLCCMMCSKPAKDHPMCWETDEYGDIWVYCKACDCWTAHPPEAIGSMREQTRRRF